MVVAVSQIGDRDVKDDGMVRTRVGFCVTHVSVKGNDTSCCCSKYKPLLRGVKNFLLLFLLFIKTERLSQTPFLYQKVLILILEKMYKKKIIYYKSS